MSCLSEMIIPPIKTWPRFSTGSITTQPYQVFITLYAYTHSGINIPVSLLAQETTSRLVQLTMWVSLDF